MDGADAIVDFWFKIRLAANCRWQSKSGDSDFASYDVGYSYGSQIYTSGKDDGFEELNQDYVVGARARGMSESYILWREVLPNAMLPLITLLGLSFGNLLGGAAVVEIVFSWPGLGYLAVQSIIYRDFQLVQGIVLWIALMYMVINLVVDISYNRLDPRLRKEGR